MTILGLVDGYARLKIFKLNYKGNTPPKCLNIIK